MEELAEYRQEILLQLEGVVEELCKIVAQIPPDAWHSPSNPYHHAPHYFLAHLQALELRLFFPQMRRIIAEDTPLLATFDENAWITEYHETSQPFQDILDEFTNLRRQEVAWLNNLPADSWSRSARHPWWGVRTLQWCMELQLDVSRQHLEELAASFSS